MLYKPPDDRRQELAEHVAEIRRLGKRVITDIVEIGGHLTECQRIVGHGNWQPFLDEIDLSATTALNFMRVFDLAKTKSTNFADLALPVSSLYLLAAPSTPEEAVTEILDRAEAGEQVTGAVVKEAIERANREKTGSAETDGTENTDIADDAPVEVGSKPEAAAKVKPPATKSPGARDSALLQFTAHVLELLRLTRKQEAGRFAKTAVKAADLVRLGRFLGDLAGGDHADDRAGDHAGGDGHVQEPEPAKVDLETLAAVWEMSTPEEQQDIRCEVLIDYFGKAPGVEIVDLISAAKRDDVVRILLDQLGVDGMLRASSPEFQKALCAKLPGKPKTFKKEHAVRTGTDATGKPKWTLQ